MDRFVVGQRVVLERTFSLEEVIAYAKITGDDNPLHVDEEYAKNSRFGGNIVHGMFVMGVVSKILGTILPGNGTIYLGQDVRFQRPVYVDKKVFIEVEIAEIENDRRLLEKISKLENEVAHEKKRDELEIMSQIPMLMSVGLYFIFPFFNYSLESVADVFRLLEEMKL